MLRDGIGDRREWGVI